MPFCLRSVECWEAVAYRRQQQQLSDISAVAGTAHLILAYGRGGGADKHVDEVVTAYEAKGEHAWILIFKPIRRRFVLSRGKLHRDTVSPRTRCGVSRNALEMPQQVRHDTVVFKFPGDYSKMVTHLRALGLQKLHIHHTRYLPYIFLKDLPTFAKSLGVSYNYMMHDFIAVCPRVHLVEGRFHYCGMPQKAEICSACVAQNGFLTVSPKDVAQYRDDYRALLSQADDLIAPSEDTMHRHKHILGDLNIRVLAHDTPPIHARLFPPKPAGEPYTVAIIGRLHRYKGADVILACARDAQARKLELRFHLIGDSVYASELRAAGVTITGAYKENELPTLLEQSGCSLVFLPSVWPETYSYVLSEIWQQGYFPVVLGLGAQAERVKREQNGMSLPYSMVETPSRINDALLKAAYVQHTA